VSAREEVGSAIAALGPRHGGTVELSPSPGASGSGLEAPRAPSEGELAPNRTGWLVGLGDLRGRLHPRFTRFLHAATGAAFGYATVANAFDFLTNDPERWTTLGLIPGAVAPLLLYRAWTAIRAARERRRATTLDDPGQVQSGTHVHLRGTIIGQPAIASLVVGQVAVLYRNRVMGWNETRGIDFWVELDPERPGGTSSTAACANPPLVPATPSMFGAFSTASRRRKAKAGAAVIRRCEPWSKRAAARGCFCEKQRPPNGRPRPPPCSDRLGRARLRHREPSLQRQQREDG
jgi:hypothetical protein